MKRVLSFGGGVDSSAILAYHLFEENLNIDHVVFADTGAESADTYRNVEFLGSSASTTTCPSPSFARTARRLPNGSRASGSCQSWPAAPTSAARSSRAT